MLALARREVDHPWFAPGQAPVILSVGRLIDYKDPQLLVEAFARLPRTMRVRLVIIGDGPLRSQVEALIARHGLAERALLLGHDPNPWRYMARARLLVLTSRYEGFGNVLVEAMATGLSVVGVDCQYGPTEILDGGRWGRLVPVSDPYTLAAAVAAALQEPADTDALRTRANEFSAASIAGQYRALVAQVT